MSYKRPDAAGLFYGDVCICCPLHTALLEDSHGILREALRLCLLRIARKILSVAISICKVSSPISDPVPNFRLHDQYKFVIYG
jgi:hypothetical protein